MWRCKNWRCKAVVTLKNEKELKFVGIHCHENEEEKILNLRLLENIKKSCYNSRK
jgi:hypothetical protein